MNNHDTRLVTGITRSGAPDDQLDGHTLGAIRREPNTAITVPAASQGRKRRKLRRYIMVAIATVAAGLALGTYYWFFVAPQHFTRLQRRW